MSWWRDILDYILPPRCLKCGQTLNENTGLCDKCIDEINFITSPYCYKCGHPLEVADTVGHKLFCSSCLQKHSHPFRLTRSAFSYDDASKGLITNFKFRDKTENARFLAQTMFVAGKDIFAEGVDVIIPVPLHYTRLLSRRYNQSSLLACELSKLSGLPMDCTSLNRHIKTRPQVELSGAARRNNVKGVFSVRHPAKIKGQRVLLIDDVLTTGATLQECALTLKHSGAQSVDALTIARVV